MDVKIKQGSEMLDATIEMVDGVMVVSPKEVKFEPKDGDVLTCGRDYEGGLSWTFILKGEIEHFHDDYKFAEEYVSLDSNDSFEISSYSDAIKWFRLATEEEKKKLFDKIAEEGFEWKPDTKELVKLKWKPKVDETCFLPCFDFPKFIAKQWLWEINGFSTYHYNEGWVFRTKEECQEFCNRLNDAINSVKP